MLWSQDQKKNNERNLLLSLYCNDFFSDYTATTILGNFQNEAAGRSVERVLEKLSKKKAAEILAVSPFAANLGHHVLLPT